MTLDSFVRSSRRVGRYGCWLYCLTAVLLCIAAMPALEALGPASAALGQTLRRQGWNEAIVGLIGGLVIGAAISPLLLIPMLPVFLLDRFLGQRCPSCGRSVTRRCSVEQVRKTGACCLCRAILFEPAVEEAHRSEMEPEEVGRFALGFVLVGLACAAILALFGRVMWVRAMAGSMGFMAASIGGGVALWCSLRLRERRCIIAAALSIPSAIAWGWMILHS